MDFRSLLFGSKLRIAALAVLLLVASVGGAFALGLLGAPGVESVQNRFGGVNETTTVVETDLVVHNPNPLGVRLGGTTVNYTVTMNDVRMASGQKEGLRLTTGNTTLNFTTYMNNERIPPWWISHVENGERTQVVIDAKIRSSLLGGRTFALPQERNVTTNIIGQFNSNRTRPINGSVPLYENPLLYLNETSGQWGEPTTEETPIQTTFTLYNPKSKPYVVSRIGYNITMNEVAIGSGSTQSGVTIPGHTTRTVEARTILNNQRLDEWWVTHLERNQVTALEIEFYAVIELPSGSTYRIQMTSVEETIRTDIFGTKDRNGSGGDGEATPTSTPTPSEGTTTDGTTTETTTEDGTGLPGDDTTTSTPTETTTDSTTTTDGTTTTGETTTSDDGLIG